MGQVCLYWEEVVFFHAFSRLSLLVLSLLSLLFIFFSLHIFLSSVSTQERDAPQPTDEQHPLDKRNALCGFTFTVLCGIQRR